MQIVFKIKQNLKTQNVKWQPAASSFSQELPCLEQSPSTPIDVSSGFHFSISE